MGQPRGDVTLVQPSGDALTHPSPSSPEGLNRRLRASVDERINHDESRQQITQTRSGVRVLFHGRLAELIGPELETDAPPGCSVAQLRDRLIAAHPQAERTLRSKRALACVGDVLVDDDYVVRGADTVEFLPPVSGG